MNVFKKLVLSVKYREIYKTNLIRYASNTPDLEKRRAELMAKGLPKQKPIPGVKNIILVSSGKGGVGKSTTSVNLAAALQMHYPDKSVGLLDADVFGPSVPLMMNLHESPFITNTNLMKPLVNYGVKCMSMGFLIDEGAPVIWRGLMVMQALEKLTRQVHWDNIDYLIVDTPPGTGDTHLSLVQNLPIAGVILVTTPQTAAIQVTKRGAVMYNRLKVPIIGLVENMSSVKCQSCSNIVQLFGDETKKLVAELNIKMLGTFALNQEISESCDKGIPIVIASPECDDSEIYKNIANHVVEFIDKKSV